MAFPISPHALPLDGLVVARKHQQVTVYRQKV